MIHVKVDNPNRRAVNNEFIHFKAPGSYDLLCNIATSRQSRLLATPEDVDCKNCWRAIQMVVREQITNLSSKGMEKVLELVAQMRNGDLRE
jgi:hypothetical protein